MKTFDARQPDNTQLVRLPVSIPSLGPSTTYSNEMK